MGTLGAARITPMALIRPAAQEPRVEVVAVAARERARAEKFASKRGIPRVHDSYEALLADPDIDAIYNPLPNSLHARWTLAALAAGKHVLCEKPFTANADEAEEVAAAAKASGKVVMEAFHWRYHPLAARIVELVQGGAIGRPVHFEAHMCIPLPMRNDIRWQYDLAGGSTMDVGCYAIHQVRTAAGAEPEVVSAAAKLRSPNIDRFMRADLRFPGLGGDGPGGPVPVPTGRILCGMWSGRVLDISMRVRGTEGELRVFNQTGPQYYHRLSVRRPGQRPSRERVRGRSTYAHQLATFAAAVLDGAPTLTPPPEAVNNMRAIDAVYEAAGLPRRGA